MYVKLGKTLTVAQYEVFGAVIRADALVHQGPDTRYALRWFSTSCEI